MKTKLDLGYLSDVLKTHYQSKSDMASSVGITRSHFQEILKNKGVGRKFLIGLKKESELKGFNYDLCLKPEPILINDRTIETIQVLSNEGHLLASITSRDVITNANTKVVVVPYEN